MVIDIEKLTNKVLRVIGRETKTWISSIGSGLSAGSHHSSFSRTSRPSAAPPSLFSRESQAAHQLFGVTNSGHIRISADSGVLLVFSATLNTTVACWKPRACSATSVGEAAFKRTGPLRISSYISTGNRIQTALCME
uniref:AlNc14C35G3129 protein n=1 Tax=Albugo laibachii Nc14 TaxID=890382 RepID=F0W8K3_9STRA|nr:AlNc14C35G3129 [Albugo laibachii Nc14]|eukprot:CCA17458.1 AlNc14C35G3129 [Albugo laibachii Nc14]